MFGKILKNLREKSPLVHSITNYVTVNDCANIILACGASPIMADDEEEVLEIVSISDGLNINIGTLNSRTIESMIIAGKKANELEIPVTLDPVGVGATELRKKTVERLMENIDFAVICGNVSEIKYIALGSGFVKGVDANEEDEINEKNLDYFIDLGKKLARNTNAVIAMTGKIDIITDGKIVYLVKNGNAMMNKVTGTGCQLSALINSYISANDNNILEATFAAVSSMGIAGDLAFNRLNSDDGNITYRNYIIDEIFNMDKEKIRRNIKYEIR